MNPFVLWFVLGLSCQMITAQDNRTKCNHDERMCGHTCFNSDTKLKLQCHCGGETFGYSDWKVCCLSDSESCFIDFDGKFSKIV